VKLRLLLVVGHGFERGHDVVRLRQRHTVASGQPERRVRLAHTGGAAHDERRLDRRLVMSKA
jgi:hypothetical protein